MFFNRILISTTLCHIISFTRSYVHHLALQPLLSLSQSKNINSCKLFRRRNSFGSRITLNLLEEGGESEGEVPLSKAPSFNGKTVFPVRVFMNGLKGHQVAAVFAILNKNYKRGEEGWNHVQHISITKDLFKEIESLQSQYSSSQIAHIRALSFVYPQKSAMEEVANKWRNIVTTEYGATVAWDDENDSENQVDETLGARSASSSDDSNTVEMTEKEKLVQLMKETAFYDDDDDDDEFEFDDDNEDMPLFLDATKSSNEDDETIVSPFDNSNENNESSKVPLTDSNGQLVFNAENVNKVLDEIRPYLINDGGNVSVQKVDEETRNVYLKLEGACGNCASSTVTMSMGITRVLKENFENLGEVVQVEDNDDGVNGDEGDPETRIMDAVVAELNRIGPAISAMGGNVEVVSVDPIGVVELRFRGSTKIQQGLELAIRDVPLVKHVKFVN